MFQDVVDAILNGLSLQVIVEPVRVVAVVFNGFSLTIRFADKQFALVVAVNRNNVSNLRFCCEELTFQPRIFERADRRQAVAAGSCQHGFSRFWCFDIFDRQGYWLGGQYITEQAGRDQRNRESSEHSDQRVLKNGLPAAAGLRITYQTHQNTTFPIVNSLPFRASLESGKLAFH